MKYKMPFSINSFYIFLMVWLIILLLSLISEKIFETPLESINTSTYIYLASVSVIWWVGFEFGKKIAVSIKKTAFNINPISLNFSKIIFLNAFLLISTFKFLDLLILTGNPSLAPENLNIYRFLVTEDEQQQYFWYINLLNGFYFISLCFIYSLYKNNKKRHKRMIILLVFIYIFYTYLSTARSSFFLSFLTLFFFLNFEKVSIRLLIFTPFLMFAVFILIGSISGKTEYEGFFLYLLAPIHAFSQIIVNPDIIQAELLSFRPIHSLLKKSGLISSTFHLLEYVYTPYPTNVYTVFGVYYHDYGYYGSLFVFFIISTVTSTLVKLAILTNSLRLKILSSVFLSFIVLGVFYDYYTSSGFLYTLPILIYLSIPAKLINKVY